jgi:hypothetical protein
VWHRSPVQLRSITLYNHAGDIRTVEFRTGALNIVTGASQTGKSALLTIVEYCLGRDSMLVPVGPITDTVSWYAALWDLDGDTRAFVARPAPKSGKASTQQAMLEFGADLEPLPFDRLEVNTDSRSLRDELGRRIGIEENLHEQAAGSLRQPLEANLGHAALLCLQAQSEIANPTQLFHRQGERGMDDALRDTLPYFLGAVPRDQALKRARLRDVRRTLQRAEAALRTAEVTAGTIDVELASLLDEARAVGLTDVELTTTRSELVNVLRAARHAVPVAETSLLDSVDYERRRALERTRDDTLTELRRVTADRALLLEQRDGETGYADALQLQAGRLTSLGLLDAPTDIHAPNGDNAPHSDIMSQGELDDEYNFCPACQQALASPDTTATQIRDHLLDLRAQLADMNAARPAQRAALTVLDEAAATARARLTAAETALSALAASDVVTAPSTGGGRDFTRGRIDATLARVNATDDVELRRLRAARDSAAATVAALEDELDDGDERERLISRLLAVGRDMTDYAERLRLEHRGPNVRLDLTRLTVVTDIDSGPVALFRIGSAENWIGYHLIAHLALHAYFTRQNRPVPRLLMLDQPTQAYYPSEVTQQSGLAANDTDREAVRRMFELIREVVAELAPELQVIVCDHANLPEEWFQDAVAHNWRNGVKLIPADWLT